MNYQDLVSVFYNRYSIVDNESVHHKIKERVMQRVIFCKEILFSPEAIAKFTLHETAHKCQMRSFDILILPKISNNILTSRSIIFLWE